MKAAKYASRRNHFLVLLYCFAGVALPRDDGFGGVKAVRYGVHENDRSGIRDEGNAT